MDAEIRSASVEEEVRPVMRVPFSEKPVIASDAGAILYSILSMTERKPSRSRRKGFQSYGSAG